MINYAYFVKLIQYIKIRILQYQFFLKFSIIYFQNNMVSKITLTCTMKSIYLLLYEQEDNIMVQILQ